MNSKEALSDLFFLAIGDENHIKECKEVIEKDLEVLEIFKDNVMIDEYEKAVTLFSKNKEVVNKIKEWLENDR